MGDNTLVRPVSIQMYQYRCKKLVSSVVSVRCICTPPMIIHLINTYSSRAKPPSNHNGMEQCRLQSVGSISSFCECWAWLDSGCVPWIQLVVMIVLTWTEFKLGCFVLIKGVLCDVACCGPVKAWCCVVHISKGWTPIIYVMNRGLLHLLSAHCLWSALYLSCR